MIPTPPKFLKATYLADAEGLLKETRSTGLYYFPGPVVAILIALLLDYSVLAFRSGSWPVFPGLNSLYVNFPSLGGIGSGTLFLDLYLLFTLVVILWALVRYLRWISTVYAVTSTRIIIQKGIFSRDFDEIPVTQVRGIDVHQRMFERILGYGSIVVSAEGGGGRSIGNETWHGIPKPFQFQKTIESASQSLMRGTWAGPSSPAPPANRYLRPPGQL